MPLPPTLPDKNDLVLIPKHALVVGATGYVGNALVQLLCAQNIHTTAHIRPNTKALDKKRQHFEEIGADLDFTSWDNGAFHQTLEHLKPTHIFACLGTTKRRQRSSSQPQEASYQAVDYALTKQLIDACRTVLFPIKFIYLSSLGASSKSPSTYLRVRGDIEDYLAATDLEYTIIQPTMITGEDRPEKRPLETITAKLQDSLLSSLAKIGLSKPYQYRSFSALELADAMIEVAFLSDYNRQKVGPQQLHELSNL